MATQLTSNVSLAYDDGVSQPISLQLAEFLSVMATKIVYRGQQLIATADTDLDLGAVATLGYFLIVNLDPTNYVDLKTQTAGTIIARLDPAGGWFGGKFGAGITAPAAIANTTACLLDILIASL